MIRIIKCSIVFFLIFSTHLCFAAQWNEHYLKMRGDVDGDKTVSIEDATSLMKFLFLGQSLPCSTQIADANIDQVVNLGDVITILSYAFYGDDTAGLEIDGVGKAMPVVAEDIPPGLLSANVILVNGIKIEYTHTTAEDDFSSAIAPLPVSGHEGKFAKEYSVYLGTPIVKKLILNKTLYQEDTTPPQPPPVNAPAPEDIAYNLHIAYWNVIQQGGSPLDPRIKIAVETALNDSKSRGLITGYSLDETDDSDLQEDSANNKFNFNYYLTGVKGISSLDPYKISLRKKDVHPVFTRLLEYLDSQICTGTSCPADSITGYTLQNDAVDPYIKHIYVSGANAQIPSYMWVDTKDRPIFLRVEAGLTEWVNLLKEAILQGQEKLVVKIEQINGQSHYDEQIVSAENLIAAINNGFADSSEATDAIGGGGGETIDLSSAKFVLPKDKEASFFDFYRSYSLGEGSDLPYEFPLVEKYFHQTGYDIAKYVSDVDRAKFIAFCRHYKKLLGGVVFVGGHGGINDITVASFSTLKRAEEYIKQLKKVGFQHAIYQSVIADKRKYWEINISGDDIQSVLSNKQKLVFLGECHSSSVKDKFNTDNIIYSSLCQTDSIEATNLFQVLIDSMTGGDGTASLPLQKAFQIAQQESEMNARITTYSNGAVAAVRRRGSATPSLQLESRATQDLVLSPYIKNIRWIGDTQVDIEFAVDMEAFSLDNVFTILDTSDNLKSAGIALDEQHKPHWIPNNNTIRIAINHKCEIDTDCDPRWYKVGIKSSLLRSKEQRQRFGLHGRGCHSSDTIEGEITLGDLTVRDGWRGARSISEAFFCGIDRGSLSEDDWFYVFENDKNQNPAQKKGYTGNYEEDNPYK